MLRNLVYKHKMKFSVAQKLLAAPDNTLFLISYTCYNKKTRFKRRYAVTPMLTDNNISVKKP